MKKLNLGCGQFSLAGYLNLDFVEIPGVDVVHDLNVYPYPFDDNEFEEVRCYHVLEHLNDIIKPLEEIWRITKSGGIIHVEVPSFPGVGAIVDPTHRQFYTYGTFDYFTKESQFYYYSKAKFSIQKREILFTSRLPLFNFLNRILNYIINKSSKLQRVYFYNFSYLYPSSTINIELKVEK